jgi:hypothetical protein
MMNVLFGYGRSFCAVHRGERVQAGTGNWGAFEKPACPLFMPQLYYLCMTVSTKLRDTRPFDERRDQAQIGIDQCYIA